MQMSTLDSYQYSNNTTILCIWSERDAGRLYESGYKKGMKKKKRYLTDIQFFTDKSSHQRKTARHYYPPMKSNIVSIGYYVWLILTRFPANRVCLLKLHMKVSKLFCPTATYVITQQSDGRTYYVM